MRPCSSFPFIALLAACSACSHTFYEEQQRSQHNSKPAPLLRAYDTRVEPVCVDGTMNYIVPVGGNDVILIDAGFQESGDTLKAAIGGRHLLAVLLTHGHPDHTAAARALGAQVYVGADDKPLLLHNYDYHAWLPHLLSFTATRPPDDALIVSVKDGQELPFGDRTVTAICVPGHTPGSMAWLIDDMIFTGDAAQAPLGDDVWPAPESVTENMATAYRSLRKLADPRYEFETMFDGHYGKLNHAKPAMIRAAFEPHTEQPSDRPEGCADY